MLVGSNADKYRLFLVPLGTINAVNEETLATYRATHKDTMLGGLLAAIVTDWYFRIPAIRLAEAHVQQDTVATYVYEFAWPFPAFGGRLGACYGLDLPFVFDNLDKKGFERLVGPDPPQQVAAATHTAWVAFATGVDPDWPQYDVKRRAVMHFDSTSELVEDPRSAERILWIGSR